MYILFPFSHTVHMSIILIRTFIVFMLLTLGLRLTGKRQIGELDVSELITTLLLSELAAAPVADPDIPLLHAAAPIFFLAALEVVLTFFTSKLPFLKKTFDGTPSVIIHSGYINQKELHRARMSVQELFCALRLQGTGDFRDVSYALMEDNGQLSVFTKSNPSNHVLNLIVSEGHICTESAYMCHYTPEALKARFSHRHHPLKDIFIFAVDEKRHEIIIYKERN